ncbi:DUF2155 domain-containing protein [Mesorhizobium sp.]|uniref:DUF2155 domain-containing protein n=1 Tax=Mesorhizobium sp. TaxID=1871066 RepID=UPI000FE58AC0|nr:DUF2155 domain-containing protein [Mesorhizobium sp.]RWI29717.1 MAG: DUF2155 domain-containing protein [Mesorhizobium sp.]RWK49639.1 MAG: DUF2155 domain-containing protein [Mesorhizobium sp.]RWK93031.1 MAG: DUF2155 domain-containing protein [Mesorhizobium sp.]TIQ27552.1 MAG: DUF2155 domain-containing protein [Mesorhizobium sp.]TJW43690.1 MAG: DUF2155 domain-containing protein [Mesorhizobium sp.]
MSIFSRISIGGLTLAATAFAAFSIAAAQTLEAPVDPGAPTEFEAPVDPGAPTEFEAPVEPDAAVEPDTTVAPAAPAAPQRITNPVAEFAGIDKITGRIITFDVYIDETVQFGALQVTPRICYSRPQTEEPKTDSFVEVDEITLDRKIRRIFTGWMFAESPGLNAVEHAVYDVWLKGCKQKSEVPAPDAAKTN